MNSDPHESKLKEKGGAEYDPGLEAVEIAKAHELAAMTEERAREIIQSLVAPEEPRPRDWSGLVEQQAIFHKHRLRTNPSREEPR